MTGTGVGSSTGAGSGALGPTPGLGDARFEDVRRNAGGRGGVPPCRELIEARLCNVGVLDRSDLPMDAELGVLRSGVFGVCSNVEEEGDRLLCRSSRRRAVGEGAGRVVQADVLNGELGDEKLGPSLF